MERLINAAVMIVAMIIPTLNAQGFEKTLHAVFFPPDGHCQMALKKEI